MTDGRLLPDDMLVLLDRASLWSRRRMSGTRQGRRQSRQQGSSLEFADYRLYVPGDDLRRLDWNAYGRTGKPFLKLFLDEQELPVTLYIDASASMAFGEQGQAAKFRYARQLAACIGYAALSGGDRIAAHLFGEAVRDTLPPLAGKASAGRLFAFLETGEAGGRGDLAAALAHPAARPRRPGMSWIFSDFLYEDAGSGALTALAAAGQETVAVQVLAPEEVDPQLTGDLKLTDSETGAQKEVALSGKVLRQYREAVSGHTESLRAFCLTRGIGFVRLTTDTPLRLAAMELLGGPGMR
ncbi:hypothetical protein J31TS4_29230 [Paenibacillus sp. J31TS4]|uniref:DUF58 domain-containing protein n=1 Tax=Paenibacillus sp. J31TS4 TaxID=2807195 RepID=UPI001B06AF81|nr:DUF58 domain-containing protein [Paenibacillus sp. J31TS4]GIP39643.1 hypothetical protein J31TS4_29230 [Paenibacillus sp. J31TS4]